MSNGSGPNGEWTDIDEYFHQSAISIRDYNLRVSIFQDSDCPTWLLTGTLKQDTFFNVLEAAAKNPNRPDNYAEILQERFQLQPLPELWNDLRRRVVAEENLHKLSIQEESAKVNLIGDRDQFIRRHILSGDEKTKSLRYGKKNPVKEWSDTEKFRVAMILAPSWGKFFPPYGTAKLTALMRDQGYSVKVYDINAESAPHLQRKHGINYWESNRYFVWEDPESFNNVLLPELNEMFDEVISDILKSKVRVVGFSIYNTNQLAVLHIAKKIRSLDPNIIILAGGPGATMTGEWWFNNVGNVFNYIFKGEAESQLLELLENLPDKNPFNEVLGSVDSRLKLEKYPFPDYSDYNLDLYEINGVSIETSRGCVAKCSFCAETHFWKYRNKDAELIVDELEHQINKYGTRRFWIVDSLINGSLKTFESWMDIAIERQLDLKWNCYSRCDGRMDADFFKKIQRSGCTMLSFGIESGSQKVLNDMHKKVQVWEILQNMKDCHAAGIFIHSSWLQGFPTERPIDHMHSRQLMFSCRKWIGGASLGMGAGITPNSDMDTNWQAYDMQWKHTNPDGTIHKGHPNDKFLGDWYTGGYKNTIIHRFLRVKLMNIWCHAMKNNFEDTLVDFGLFYSDIDKFYSLTYEKKRDVDQLEQNNFIDLKQGITNDLAGQFLEDYLGFMYSLYEVYGSHTWTFHCDPDLDKKNFGSFLSRNYWCDLSATIDNTGNYTMTVHHKLDHTDPNKRNDDDKKIVMYGDVDYASERKRQDMSFEQTITLTGNVNNWISDTIQVEETVHPQYRKKTWKLTQIDTTEPA